MKNSLPFQRSLFLIVILLMSSLLTACGSEQPKTYTIGVINIVPTLNPILDGFKEGMKELGYTDQNVTYVYKGATTDMRQLDAVAQELVEANVDLILAITTPSTKAAQKATAGTAIPIVFVPVTDPVAAGLVDSLKEPGGNTTGITFGIQEARRLEWLVKVAPTIKQIYTFYNSKDASALQALKTMTETAAKLKVEVITRPINTSEEITTAIKNIPEEADALFMLPDSLVSTRLADIEKAAIQHKLPTSWSTIEDVKKNGVLISYSFEQLRAGKQAARLAHQIFQGVKPADLPVETAEFFLAINLKTAKAINLDVSNEVLQQANIIIR